MNVSPAVLVLAVSSLLIGLAVYGYLTTGNRTQYFNTLNVIAWLLVALFPVLLLFSFFPDSSFSTSKGGVSAGGAIAAFIFIWWRGTRAGLRAMEQDEFRRQLAARDSEVSRLKAEVASIDTSRKPEVIRETLIYHYRIQGGSKKALNVATGNLAKIDFVDVWVNSENTNMQMASFFDRSVSGLIRYLGARRDVAGYVVEDVIGNAISDRLGKRVVVAPGTVTVTESGGLRESNNVKAILHVAAVHGQAGVGYTQIPGVGSCVENALREVDEHNRIAGDTWRSIVFPLMGAGQGRGEIRETMRSLSLAAADYVCNHSDTTVEDIYFLAFTDAELDACRAVLAESERFSFMRTGRPKRASKVRAAT